MAKPTLEDIAARAGVGRATVERVLNARGGVRAEKVMQVVAAARALDWPGRLPELHRGILRIEVLLVRPDTAFYRRMTKAFQRIGASIDRSVQLVVTHLDEADPEAIARHISTASFPRAGLVVAAPDRPQVRAALDAVARTGLPVVQVVERIADRAEFVGIDNYAVGRTAGLMLTRMCAEPGRVLAICHSGNYSGHRARLRGFSDYLAEQGAARHPFVFTAFGQDSRDLNALRLAEALRDWPDLVAVYNAGGGNRLLFDLLSHQKRHIFFLGHELTETSGAALQTGVADVIFDQLPEAQARRAVDLVMSRLGLTDGPVENPPIRFTTVLSENI